jgi:hypothetical protein
MVARNGSSPAGTEATVKEFNKAGGQHADQLLSREANHAGWLSFSAALASIEKAPGLLAAYEALTASSFDRASTQRHSMAEAVDYVGTLTDEELSKLEDLMTKATGFDRPPKHILAFTARSFRRLKRDEALAHISAERMRRRIAFMAPELQPCPQSTLLSVARQRRCRL